MAPSSPTPPRLAFRLMPLPPLTRPARGLSLWLAPFLLWAIVTIIALQFSSQFGRLSITSAYDDVSYLCQGALSIDALREHGLKGLARQIWTSPPHSPLFWAITFLGFLVGGIRDWIPYAIHSGVLLVVFCGAAWFLRWAQRFERVAALIILAFLPASWLTVTEFRPDAAASFFIALACLLLLERVPGKGPRRRVIVSLLTLALLAKPTVFPATICLFGLSSALACTLAWSRQPHQQSKRAALFAIAGRCLRISLLAALIVLPYYLLAGPQLIRYIRATFKDVDVWSFGTTKFSLAQHLAYYFHDGAKFMGVRPLRIVLIVGGICYLFVLIRGSKRARLVGTAALLVTLGSFAIVLANKIKTPYFGLTFYSFLILGMAAGLGQIAARASLPRRRPDVSQLVAVIAGVIALVGFQIPQSPILEVTPARKAADRVFQSALAAAIEHAPAQHTRAFLPHVGHLGNPLLAYEGAKVGIYFDAYTSEFETSQEIFDKAFDKADMVLISENSADEVNPNFPVYAALPNIWNWIAQRSDYGRRGLWQTPSGGRIALYSKHRPFEGFATIDGLGRLEGPYPQWDMPSVRWANLSGVKMTLGPGTDRVLTLRVRCMTPKQTITAHADDAVIGTWEMIASGIPSNFSCPIPDAASRVELRFTDRAPTGPGESAALFEGIQITQGKEASIEHLLDRGKRKDDWNWKEVMPQR